VRGLAFALIILANLIGGSTYLAQKLALEGLPAATVTVLRNGIAMLCLMAWAARSGGLRLRFTAREHGRLALIGVLGYALPLLLGIWGLRGSTAGNASILILLEPPSIMLFACLLLGERIRWLQGAGLVAGLAGALWIVVGDPGQGPCARVRDDHRCRNALGGHQSESAAASADWASSAEASASPTAASASVVASLVAASPK